MSEIGFVSARVEKHLNRDLYLIGLKRSSLFPKGRFFYEEELQKRDERGQYILYREYSA